MRRRTGAALVPGVLFSSTVIRLPDGSTAMRCMN